MPKLKTKSGAKKDLVLLHQVKLKVAQPFLVITFVKDLKK